MTPKARETEIGLGGLPSHEEIAHTPLSVVLVLSQMHTSAVPGEACIHAGCWTLMHLFPITHSSKCWIEHIYKTILSVDKRNWEQNLSDLSRLI